MAAKAEANKPLEIIRRLYAIVEIVRSKGGGPTNMQEFQSKLEERGFEDLSRRTIFRHIELLRDSFGIYITYDYSLKRYVIEQPIDEVPDNEQLESLVGLVSSAEKLDKLLAFSGKLKSIIRYEHEQSLRYVVDLLDPLLEAVYKKRMVEFYYQSFKRRTAKKHKVEPYVIAERNNRWYVVGFDVVAEDIRTFGLERIQPESLSLQEEFKDNRGFNYEERYAPVVGIELRNEPVETIQLEVSASQLPYLESIPLHPSQTIVERTKDGAILNLEVIPNFELEMKILALGEQVTVLKPKSLRKNLKKRLKSALKNYN